MNNQSLTTKNNQRAFDALNKLTPLRIDLIAHKRITNMWKLRNSIPMYIEDGDTFKQNMQLIDENTEDFQEAMYKVTHI